MRSTTKKFLEEFKTIVKESANDLSGELIIEIRDAKRLLRIIAAMGGAKTKRKKGSLKSERGEIADLKADREECEKLEHDKRKIETELKAITQQSQTRKEDFERIEKVYFTLGEKARELTIRVGESAAWTAGIEAKLKKAEQKIHNMRGAICKSETEGMGWMEEAKAAKTYIRELIR